METGCYGVIAGGIESLVSLNRDGLSAVSEKAQLPVDVLPRFLSGEGALERAEFRRLLKALNLKCNAAGGAIRVSFAKHYVAWELSADTWASVQRVLDAEFLDDLEIAEIKLQGGEERILLLVPPGLGGAIVIRIPFPGELPADWESIFKDRLGPIHYFSVLVEVGSKQHRDLLRADRHVMREVLVKIDKDPSINFPPYSVLLATLSKSCPTNYATK